MACFHDYNIVQNSFPDPKTFRALPLPPSLHPEPWRPLIFILSPSFCLFQNAVQLELYSMQPSHIGFFHLIIYTVKFPPRLLVA